MKANEEGILRWIVECGVDYSKCSDMDLPDIIRQTKEEYRRDMSPHLDFINSRYKLDEGEPLLNHRVRKVEFLEDFKQYWHENGNGKYVKKQAVEAFGSFLTSKKIKGCMYYIGIEPKDDEDGDDDDTDDDQDDHDDGHDDHDDEDKGQESIGVPAEAENSRAEKARAENSQAEKPRAEKAERAEKSRVDKPEKPGSVDKGKGKAGVDKGKGKNPDP